MLGNALNATSNFSIYVNRWQPANTRATQPNHGQRLPPAIDSTRLKPPKPATRLSETTLAYNLLWYDYEKAYPSTDINDTAYERFKR